MSILVLNVLFAWLSSGDEFPFFSHTPVLTAFLSLFSLPQHYRGIPQPPGCSRGGRINSGQHINGAGCVCPHHMLISQGKYMGNEEEESG